MPKKKVDKCASSVTQNCTPDALPESQISAINCEIVDDDSLLSQKIGALSIKQKHEIYLANGIIDSSLPEIELETVYDNRQMFPSRLFSIQEKKNVEISTDEFTIKQCLEPVNKSLMEIVENHKEKNIKNVLDVDGCSWKDLYDEKDDYIHTLLMKELISLIGEVQVIRAKEDYHNHQTFDQRTGDGECVIEIYGFSSDLKSVDLIKQFSAFHKKTFTIVWVDDTHALAVFQSPQLADKALTAPYSLVKTRPLKNSIRESKLKAERVPSIRATRPITSTGTARRLICNSLGLKANVSPGILNAERVLLENAKEKKNCMAQQKPE